MMSVIPTQWQPYWQLARLDKPIGTLLLLWPTLWALWLASGGMPSFSLLIVFSLGVVVMRAAGCVINDYADRHFDGHVKRTAFRPLPSGRITTFRALSFFLILVVVAFLLVWQLNRFTIYLSTGGLLLAAVYPFMKRVTSLPQVILGMAFSWAIPMAYAAVTGHLSLISWLLFLANLLWTVAYDTMYAMVDRDDDVKIGIKSTAILFGKNDRLYIALLQFSTLALLSLVGWLSELTISYFMALLVALCLFIYQQYLIWHRQRDACFKAFLNNNWVGVVVFAGILFSQW
ncbi:4-hydroxybenzoate octaprenyltransferase [Tolumonas lignilytica]|uniref:4-hydroxybenzoate octaprenyltransferase n=1 Tax=Tolumonas lignilytica TaxID=1283284 RepID=UPI000462EDB8|nr:4-hydroxybenzoate octaprenyltransferase [Tolumonas lignilytica]